MVPLYRLSNLPKGTSDTIAHFQLCKTPAIFNLMIAFLVCLRYHPVILHDGSTMQVTRNRSHFYQQVAAHFHSQHKIHCGPYKRRTRIPWMQFCDQSTHFFKCGFTHEVTLLMLFVNSQLLSVFYKLHLEKYTCL